MGPLFFIGTNEQAHTRTKSGVQMVDEECKKCDLNVCAIFMANIKKKRARESGNKQFG